MKNAIVVGALGVAISAAMLAFGIYAGSSQAHVTQSPQALVSAPALDRSAVEEVVRSYLLENPEILTEMQSVLEERQKDAERVAQVDTIRTASADIFDSAHDGIFGNPDGDVTIVEFFDYNCGFCKRALGDMEAMVAADPKLRFVLKEFPILGPDSQRAHVVSMAFRQLHPEKYGDFHLAMMKSAGRATEESAIRTAVSLGADEAQLREAMKNPEIASVFAGTYELANRLAITGTPSYVIGEEVVFGAMGRELLGEKVEIARN